MNRSGIGLLPLVLVLTFAAGVCVLAYHSLGVNAARNLFSLQEHRVLNDLARSALDEAYFTIECALEEGSLDWSDWVRQPGRVTARSIPPAKCRELIARLGLAGAGLTYELSDVTVSRVTPLGPPRRDGRRILGLVDTSVAASVRRDSPRHSAKLVLAQRRYARSSGEVGPFSATGRHSELSLTPVTTWIP